MTLISCNSFFFVVVLCYYRSAHVLVALQKSIQSGRSFQAMANHSLVAGRPCKYCLDWDIYNLNSEESEQKQPFILSFCVKSSNI